MKNTVPSLINIQGVYGKPLKVHHIYGGFILIEAEALNSRSATRYLTIVDRDGMFISGVKSNGIANWSQRMVNGKLWNSHIVISNEYPSEKRYEVIQMVKMHFGPTVRARIQRTDSGSWNKAEIGAIDI